MLDFTGQLRALQQDGRKTVTDLVDFIVRVGIERGASDIHFEPLADALAIRFRLDGLLAEMGRLPRTLAPNVIGRLKVMADLLTYRYDIPQEGRIKAEMLGKLRIADCGLRIEQGSGVRGQGLGKKTSDRSDQSDVSEPSDLRTPASDLHSHAAIPDLRLATFPTVQGEKAVVRIFDRAQRLFHLEELGFGDDTVAHLRALIREPEGMLLLTGPAGSGKTTTIYAALSEIVRTTGISRQIVTIEDPVEFGLEGVTQTQINLAAGLTFATGLRSLMRQDPQIIVVGEIRDVETARAAVEAGLTGHLVISTIHAGTAVGVFVRLIEMGIEPSMVTSVVQSVLAQRLVRRVCAECGKPNATPDNPQMAQIHTDEEEGKRKEPNSESVKSAESADGPVRQSAIRNPQSVIGCPSCAGIGYRGRTAIGELLSVGPDLRQAILTRTDVRTLAEVARLGGYRTLVEDGMRLVKAGVTTVEELRRVLPGERVATVE